MGEPQKVKRPGLLRQLTLRTGLSRTPERHQPRLLRVETQAVLFKPLEEDSADLLRITPMREANHHVISVPHRKYTACHSLSYNILEPAVEYFVQIYIAEDCFQLPLRSFRLSSRVLSRCA